MVPKVTHGTERVNYSHHPTTVLTALTITAAYLYIMMKMDGSSVSL